jgi:hypothetical protein
VKNDLCHKAVAEDVIDGASTIDIGLSDVFGKFFSEYSEQEDRTVNE